MLGFWEAAVCNEGGLLRLGQIWQVTAWEIALELTLSPVAETTQEKLFNELYLVKLFLGIYCKLPPVLKRLFNKRI